MGIRFHPEIKIHRLETDLVRAIRIIDKFLTINKIDLKYSISLDYHLDAFGEFNPSKKNEIKLNPAAFYNTSKEKPWAKNYSEDYSLFSVAIHEFNHLLDERTHLLKKYEKVFPDCFHMNHNCKSSDRREELAEVLTLYFTNPFFLKMINKPRFEFFKGLFLSPSPITKKSFIAKWKKWNPQIHQLCLERWGIKVLGNRVFVE